VKMSARADQLGSTTLHAAPQFSERKSLSNQSWGPV
jgi:hypothetical protein